MPNENEEVIEEDIEININDVPESEENEVAPQEDIDDLRKRIKTLEAQKEHWRTKAEDSKRDKSDVKKDSYKKEELSTLDIIALSKANIDADDIDEVLDYAKFKRISVQEALKSNIIKSSLSEKEELRKSATATNTGASRRGSTATSDEQLLINARKGVMPDSEADIERLLKLKRERK